MSFSRSLLAAACLAAVSSAHAQDDALIAKAKAIHAKAIKIDTHVDFNAATMAGAPPNYATGLPRTQVDLPKMEKNGLDAVFFSIYVGQRDDFSDSAYAAMKAANLRSFDAVHALAERVAPDRIAIAYTADDVRRIHASGKKVALMGVENAYGIGNDLSTVALYYQRGARYISLAHNGHNQLSDSNTGERDNVWKWNGLSPLGRQVVAEANRLGMMMDISHPSKASNLQVMALSKAPVIASHSSVRALCDHSRNLDDEQLLALKQNGGVVQIVAFAGYVKLTPPDSPERAAAITALRQELGFGGRGGAGAGGAGQQARRAPSDSLFAIYRERLAAIDAKFPPPPRATVKDFVNHIDYAVKLIGIDHVGISSDFDGGGGVEGYDNASESINVTTELVRRGYSEQDIIKLWGGNLLRVMHEVERVAGR
ncbi:MAG: membrane dipeptidase [Gemmatimonadaceae bacterium]|nr:membrane dipeptidase [Gemmatimonadaceae bacterium]